MTRKIYRTANGKMVDLGALQLQNENVRAVGNMGVNARGDIIDSSNKTINTRNQQVARQYRKQTNVSDTPVATSRKSTQPQTPTSPAKTKSKVVPLENNVPAENSTTQQPIAASGLAAAIAKAREIKQEPLDPAPSRTQDSITKI